MRKMAWGVLITLLALLCGAFFWSSHNSLIFVHGSSMEPTFSDGDILVVKNEKDFTVGRIVMFPVPTEWKSLWKGNDSDRLVKHIAVAPGQTVHWDGHAWSVNGEIFSSLKEGVCKIEPMDYTLKADEIFVKGDTTTEKTLDSREAFCNGVPFTVKISTVETLGSLKRIL